MSLARASARRASLAAALALALAAGCARGADDAVRAEERSAAVDATGTETAELARELASARSERAEERAAMVAEQVAARGITDERVLAALRAVPRHAFVPAGQRAFAYEDRPLPIGLEQTISQPFVVATMTAALALEETDRVLEIGTGSGYQAAVLAELTPHVFTIEIVEELGRRAAATLAALGYDAVRCRIGDGWAGWPEAAPFDAILVTAAPGEVPPALLEQLAPGGRLCMPVGDTPWNQELVLLEKDAEGALRRTSLGPVRFVPMTGEAQER